MLCTRTCVKWGVACLPLSSERGGIHIFVSGVVFLLVISPGPLVLVLVRRMLFASLFVLVTVVSLSSSFSSSFLFESGLSRSVVGAGAR